MATPSTLARELTARVHRGKTSLEHGAAQLAFQWRGKRAPTPLSCDQIRSYDRDGYLLVSGLIAEDLVRAAEAATWQALGASRERRDTWEAIGPRPFFLRDERLLSCYTEELLAAAAQLAGEHPATFRRPSRTMTVNRLPVSGASWRCLGAHLDYSLEQLRHRSLPRPFRIAAMTYLTPVRRHGGATIVWPGSHLAVSALARSEPLEYEYVSVLSREAAKLDLGAFVEIEAGPGDVLFHHAFCVHAGSDNVSDAPRLALNQKW